MQEETASLQRVSSCTGIKTGPNKNVNHQHKGKQKEQKPILGGADVSETLYKFRRIPQFLNQCNQLRRSEVLKPEDKEMSSAAKKEL